VDDNPHRFITILAATLHSGSSAIILNEGLGAHSLFFGGSCSTYRLLAVDFHQPRTLVMSCFELHFGTNPPLGILMI
jgi:hypothetical protein